MRPKVNVRRTGAIAPLAVFAVALALAIAAEQAFAQKPRVSETKQIEVTATPLVGLQASNVDRRDFGRLRWRGGLVLTSSDPGFGGLSGLVLDTDGRRLLAISDTGAWFTADLTYDGSRPAAIRNARLGPLRTLQGRPLTRNRDRDAEALTLAEGTLRNGTVLIGFEANHRIGRFPLDGSGVAAPQSYIKLPAEARQMRSNEGFESVSVLRGGRHKGAIVAFAERLPDDRGHHTGWIWLNGEPRKLHLTDIGGFDITGAAALDDGGLIVLERRFRWTEGVKMRLRLINAAEIAPGAVMSGEVLFQADMAYRIDNMEGIAVHRGEHGETVVTVISDDNFNPFLQRTLLLQFTLKAAED